ncbi:MAG: heme lyase CcmF/NrfE family subunit [Vibrio sp.]
MLAEIGHLVLIFAFLFSVLGSVTALFAIRSANTRSAHSRSASENSSYYWSAYSRLMVYLAFICVLASTIILALGFVHDDFSLAYIAQHSNSHLPVFYKIAAVWGGHEGSFLFWLLSLLAWSALVAFLGKSQNFEFQHWTQLILCLISVAIAGYILWASNPFVRLDVVPFEGRDLNPMLQDIGLIVHPPMLYLGYVGFAVSFAMALANLITKDKQSNWASLMVPWVISSWGFLTAGIALGAWWAYNELGWGGWWFWDPVENASLMPWLTGTALMHSLMVSKKPSVLSGWSLLLAIFSFSLSILGTFIVRSGVLTSVHAFAADPTRGAVLLAILAIVVVLSLGVFAYRVERYVQPMTFDWLSLPMFIFIANGLFAIATFSVLMGTLYPMILPLFDLGNISVGAPYFNSIFVPITFVLCVMMSVTPFMQKNAPFQYKPFISVFVGSSVIGALIAFMSYKPEYQWFEKSYVWVVVALVLGFWVMIATIYGFIRAKNKWRTLPMLLAHFGVAIAVIAAGFEQYASIETNQKMQHGSVVELNGYQIKYQQQNLLIGDNYTAEQIDMVLMSPQGEVITHLYPERRHYTVRVMNMTESAVYSSGLGDWYITLGDKLDSKHFAVRIQYKPMMQWLWYASGLMVLAAFGSVIRRIWLSLFSKSSKVGYKPSLKQAV